MAIKIFKYFYKNFAANMNVAVQDKWMVVRLFEQRHCRFYRWNIIKYGVLLPMKCV